MSLLQNISVRFEYLRDFLKSFPRLLEERTVIRKHTNTFSKLRTSILGITAKHRNIIFRNRTSSVYFTYKIQSAKTFIYRRPTLYPLEIAVDFLKSL